MAEAARNHHLTDFSLVGSGDMKLAFFILPIARIGFRQTFAAVLGAVAVVVVGGALPIAAPR